MWSLMCLSLPGILAILTWVFAFSLTVLSYPRDPSLP